MKMRVGAVVKVWIEFEELGHFHRLMIYTLAAGKRPELPESFARS